MTRLPWGWMGASLVSLLGLALVIWTAIWVSHAESAIGTAGHTSFRRSTTSKAPGTHTVYVTFAPRDGPGKTVGLTVFSRDSYPSGSSVPVIFDPKQPGSSARLNTFVDLWLAPAFILGWGFLWLIGLIRRRRL